MNEKTFRKWAYGVPEIVMGKEEKEHELNKSSAPFCAKQHIQNATYLLEDIILGIERTFKRKANNMRFPAKNASITFWRFE